MHRKTDFKKRPVTLIVENFFAVSVGNHVLSESSEYEEL